MGFYKSIEIFYLSQLTYKKIYYLIWVKLEVRYLKIHLFL